jgi:hypothetical protein
MFSLLWLPRARAHYPQGVYLSKFVPLKKQQQQKVKKSSNTVKLHIKTPLQLYHRGTFRRYAES